MIKKLLKKLLKHLIKGFLLAVFSLCLIGSSATLFESYIYDYKGNSVVKLTAFPDSYAGGTGFSIKTEKGNIYTLTNAHVCEVSPIMFAHKQNGQIQQVRVLKVYKKHDLCLMEQVHGLRPLKIASSIDLHERVWLVGHPGGRPLTMESGHYAGDRTIKLMVKCKKRKRKIKEDAVSLFQLLGYCLKPMKAQYINNISYGGNSGSPVLNIYGNVVGVLFANSRGNPSDSYTVPLWAVHDFLKDK